MWVSAESIDADLSPDEERPPIRSSVTQRREERLGRARAALQKGHSMVAVEPSIDATKLARANMATHASGSLLAANEVVELEGSAPSPELSPLPRFVRVDKLRWERTCLGVRRAGTYMATFSSLAEEDRLVSSSIIPPVLAQKELAIFYTSCLGRGMTHTDAMAEIETISEVTPGWRDATIFSGAFDADKLRTGWRLAWALTAGLLLLLVMDFLTLYELLPFLKIGETLLLGFFVEPAFAAISLAFEALMIIIALFFVKRLLERVGLGAITEAVGGALENVQEVLMNRLSNATSAFDNSHASSRSSGWDPRRTTRQSSRVFEVDEDDMAENESSVLSRVSVTSSVRLSGSCRLSVSATGAGDSSVPLTSPSDRSSHPMPPAQPPPSLLKKLSSVLGGSPAHFQYGSLERIDPAGMSERSNDDVADSGQAIVHCEGLRA